MCLITLHGDRVRVFCLSHYIRGRAGVLSIITLRDWSELQPPAEALLSCFSGGKRSVFPFPLDRGSWPSAQKSHTHKTRENKVCQFGSLLLSSFFHIFYIFLRKLGWTQEAPIKTARKLHFLQFTPRVTSPTIQFHTYSPYGIHSRMRVWPRRAK